MALAVLGTRVMSILNLAPVLVSTRTLYLQAYRGTLGSRSALHAQLQRLERVKKIVRVSGRTKLSGLYWTSMKWVERAGAPERVPIMAESMRDSLPSRRRCITQKVRVNGQGLYYTIGLYPDGRPGELFIDIAKAGAALRTWAGESAMMVSIALQHGTPLKTVLDLFIGTRCEPCGEVEGHPRIRTCTSIMDLIARDLAITFLGREDMADTIDWSLPPLPISDRSELPPPVLGQACSCHLTQD